ncbi:MAG: hypothetical protein RJA70_1738 [Pseudomonadota bacterium]|jgi:hypothetical protein
MKWVRPRYTGPEADQAHSAHGCWRQKAHLIRLSRLCQAEGCAGGSASQNCARNRGSFSKSTRMSGIP